MDTFNTFINLKYKGMKDFSSLKHFVGCDVSKNTLDFALHVRGRDYRTFDHIQTPNSLEGFQAMRKWLRTFKIKIQDCVIGMEHTGSYSEPLAQWCFKKKIPFVFLHPMDVKNACSRGRNKTDKIDAQFIADYIYTMREKLSPSSPETDVIRRLRQLRNERQMAVRSRTSYLNLSKSFTDSHSANRVKKIISLFDSQIKAIEDAISEVVASDETVFQNYRLLISIPGIGMINAMTIIIATGNFTRFQTSRQYAKFCCVSPLTRQSGTSVNGGNHTSKAGHNELKAVLTEGARSAIHHDKQLKAYYERKRAEGKSHGCVLNAVKFKLICRMFAVVQRQSPYVNTDRYRS